MVGFAAMKRSLFALALVALAGCGGGENKSSVYEMSTEPVSVRGWILDVKGAQHSNIPDVEIARRTQLFQSSSVWVENTEYASGGIAENGAFIILDVPPLNATVGFNAPGAETAKLVMKDVPGTADVFIPDVVLEPGGATVLDPKKILVRVPAEVSTARRTNRMATIAGYKVPIIETPLGQMTDRREYPNPGGFRPVATVR
jgi:hypothetical protein